jgi:hypothetical protein
MISSMERPVGFFFSATSSMFEADGKDDTETASSSTGAGAGATTVGFTVFVRGILNNTGRRGDYYFWRGYAINFLRVVSWRSCNVWDFH